MLAAKMRGQTAAGRGCRGPACSQYAHAVDDVVPSVNHQSSGNDDQRPRPLLFYKLMSATRLTPAGEALLRRVKLAIAEVQAMEGDLAAWKGEIRGRIVVGVLPLSVKTFLPQAVDALLAIHPNIEIQIVDGTYESLVQQVLSADVDAIAGALRADAPSVVLHAVRHLRKPMDLVLWLGANRSDTPWYREDLQRRHGAKDAVLCAE
ncbi:MAG: LysR family transcriptional regulator [Rubrivivax sp.]|nr:LysR family transcriptional regulator [Rubrivivax sp.]